MTEAREIKQGATSAPLGFEAQLWADACEAHHAKLEAERDQGADPEDPDLPAPHACLPDRQARQAGEYRTENIFWVPAGARWSHLKKNARQPTTCLRRARRGRQVGQLVDDAMEAVERDNPSLKGVLPKDYARPALDKQRLGQLIDLVTNIHLGGGDLSACDLLARRAQASAQAGNHGGRIGDISIYGQGLNYTTWRLAKMNLAIRGIDGRIDPPAPKSEAARQAEQGDSFTNDRFPDLKADYILANPPFNMKRWGGEHLREEKLRYERGATSGAAVGALTSVRDFRR